MGAEKQKLLAGEPYDPSDPELQAEAAAAGAWMARYNESGASSPDQRLKLLRLQLGHVGERVNVRPPLYIDYGYNIRLGDGVFLNFGCVMLDVTQIDIGAGAQIGPGVQILTADHPRDAARRRAGVEFGRPIRIGANVWIGGGALILPGVSIGDDAIIGAGAVVTHDVPAGATATGNPARLS